MEESERKVPPRGRRKRQEKRRLQAGAMFAEGVSQAEVARRLNVSRRSAHLWHKAWKEEGETGLQAQGRPGREYKISDDQLSQLELILAKGPIARGYENDLWTLPRIGKVVSEEFSVKLGKSGVWNLLQRLNWSSQKPSRKARERDEEKIEQWKSLRWPELREKARVEERTIIFVDESGLAQKPATKKTWAPCGQTPQVEMNFGWKTLSVIGGLSLKSIYFQIHEQSIKSEQVVEFLKHMQTHIKGKLLVIWDGLAAHRSKIVKEYLATTRGHVWVERLPAYAPELNPIEYLWGHIKNTDLANFAPEDLHQLSDKARQAIRRTRKRPRCIRAFWIQAELPL